MKLVNLDNIPHKPYDTYKKEWTSWPDFLNNGFDRNYVSYEEAKKLCLENGIDNRKKYNEAKKYIKGLPGYPDGVYKNKGWTGWDRFFNLEKRIGRKYMDIDSAKEFLHPLKLTRKTYKKNFKTLPKNIPYKPDEHYKNKGWKNWEDYLGKKSYKNIKMSSLEEAVVLVKQLIKTLRIESNQQYQKLWDMGMIPESLPKYLDRHYKVNDVSLFGFDCRNTGKVTFCTIEDFKKWCLENNIKSSSDFRNFSKDNMDRNIPKSPEAFYKKTNSWPGWSKLLDNGNERVDFISFSEAREWVRKQKISSFSDWQKFCKSGKRPLDIPSNPGRVYKDNGWLSWGDWLGNGLGPNGKILNKY